MFSLRKRKDALHEKGFFNSFFAHANLSVVFKQNLMSHLIKIEARVPLMVTKKRVLCIKFWL